MTKILNDLPDEDEFDYLIPSYEDYQYGLDIEAFIHSLSYQETLTLLFLSLSFKPKEIRDIMGFKNVNSIGKIVMTLKDKYKKEYF